MSLLIELLTILLDNIIPILLVAGVGFAAGRRLNLEPKPLARLIFHVFSPALVFESLSKSQISFAELGQILLVMALFFAFMAAITYFGVRRVTEDPVERAGVILSAVAPNNGNLGLPLINFAFGAEVFARAAVIFVATAILNNTGGVYIASSGRRTPPQALLKIARVPVVYGVILGLLVKRAGITLPLALDRSVHLLAEAAIPTMLILLGLQLAASVHVTRLRLLGVSAFFRLLVGPVVAMLLVFILDIQSPASIALIMQASMPVAVFTTIFATEFDLDGELASSMVLVTTLISPLTLSVLILALRDSLV